MTRIRLFLFSDPLSLAFMPTFPAPPPACASSLPDSLCFDSCFYDCDWREICVCWLYKELYLILCTVSVFIIASVTIDIERRVINVIENQAYVEVCLVKSGPSSRPIMALVNAEELTGNVGSPGGPFSVVLMSINSKNSLLYDCQW